MRKNSYNFPVNLLIRIFAFASFFINMKLDIGILHKYTLLRLTLLYILHLLREIYNHVEHSQVYLFQVYQNTMFY